MSLMVFRTLHWISRIKGVVQGTVGLRLLLRGSGVSGTDRVQVVAQGFQSFAQGSGTGRVNACVGSGVLDYIGSIGFVAQRNGRPGVQKIEPYTLVL